MPQFQDFAGMAAHFERVIAALPTARRQALDQVGQHVADAARGKLGDYQPAAGPFAAWASLAPATLGNSRRQALLATAGRGGDSPLLVTGQHIEATITHRTVGTASHIGSDDAVVEYQEVGTNRIPARSFLGSSLFEQSAHCHTHFMQRILRLIRDAR